MINRNFIRQNVISKRYVHSVDYIITFGAITAPNTIDIFYGAECGFSKEFFQSDFKNILEKFVKTKKAFIRLYPAALDPMTAIFAELIRMVKPSIKRQIFTQFCQGALAYKKLLPESPSESVYFDLTKILAKHPEITETLMVKINGSLLNEVPSLYSIELAMS